MQSVTKESNFSAAKQARVKVAERQRRVIFNDDTHELALQGANTPEGFLEHRLKPLVGTHVDTISWSVLGGQFDAPVYDSRVQPIYGDAHGGPPSYWSAATGNVKALIKTGRCPLQIVIDFAHDNGMEAWASVRMNDVHDSFIKGGITTWKYQHPQLLVDTKGVLHNLELYVTSQDFSHEEVRQRKLEIIQEICERYDIDGFELDYIRHPVFFSRTMRGEPVRQQEVEIMTSFMRRIRQITDDTATHRGRSLLIATRVPDSFELAKNVGLDLKAWLQEDLVDILIAGGGYAPFTLPLKEFTQAAHQYKVPVHPCINLGTAQNVSKGAFLECVRALAVNWYEAGADGIYTWNLGSSFEFKTGKDLISTRQSYYACLNEIGDPQMLKGKDKLFCVDGQVTRPYQHISSQLSLPVVSKQDYPGVVGRIPLFVGDDLNKAKKNDLIDQMKLSIKLKGLQKETLLFRLNGEKLADGEFLTTNNEKSECQIDYLVNTPPLKRGYNFIEWTLKNIPSSPIQLYEMRLKVEYKAEGDIYEDDYSTHR